MWQFSRRDRKTLIQQARDRRKLPLINRQTLPRKYRQPLRIFPVVLVKDGGSDGDISTECSYTYTVKLIDGTTSLASNVDPTTGLAATTTAHGGTCRHPGALGSIEEADAGQAYWNGDGFIVICAFNERQNVAPCP